MFVSTFYGQSIALKLACSNPRFTEDFVRKCRFCVFNESTYNFEDDSDIFRDLCLGECKELFLIFYLVQIKNSRVILSRKTCKVTFGF